MYFKVLWGMGLIIGEFIFTYILNIIHMDNVSCKNNFFNCDRIKRNVNILIRILNEYLISLNHDFKDVRTTSRICNIFNVKY